MSPRFTIDEHIAHAVAFGLRQRGVDVETVAEIGMIGATDEQHLTLTRARAEGRVFVTMDDDFLVLSAQDVSQAGIVFTRDRSIGEIIRRLARLHDNKTAERMTGQIVYL